MKNKTLVSLLVLLVALSLGPGSAFGQTKTGKKAEPATKSEKSDKKAAKKTDVIDINSATKQELMTLPGIGDANAQKIIDGRPYRAKNQLVQKNIIPQATYDKISDQIIAKQNTAGGAKKVEPTDKGTAKKGTTKK